MSLGAAHGLALRSDGSVWGWGSNPSGELGDGSSGTQAPTPVRALGVSLH